MCFNTPKAPEPSAPPEVLKQSDPARKDALLPQTSALSLGTRKYSSAQMNKSAAPSGIALAK